MALRLISSTPTLEIGDQVAGRGLDPAVAELKKAEAVRVGAAGEDIAAAEPRQLIEAGAAVEVVGAARAEQTVVAVPADGILEPAKVIVSDLRAIGKDLAV